MSEADDQAKRKERSLDAKSANDASNATPEARAGEMKPEEKHDPSVKRKFFTRVALAGSQELRKQLPLDETHYLRLTLEAQSDARAYFTYSVLDSVYEVGVAMMRWEELLADGKAAADGSIEGRLVEESIAAEAAMWTRRLIEVLTMLICFSSTNEEPYYRHWLLLDQLDSFNFKRKDQLDYFACEQKGIAHWIDETALRIRALEASIDFTRCWYLENKRALPPAPQRPLLNSFAAKLRAAIPLAKPREKGELGLSYQQFSRVSGSIHFSPGDKWYERSDADLEGYFSYCWLLVQSILLRVIELNSMKPTGICKRLVETYDANTSGDDFARRMTTGRAKVGDFVVVGRSLARVLAVKTSTYAYESYTVKYLEDPPSPGVIEDDVLPYNIRRLHEAARIKQKVFELLKKLAPDSKRLMTFVAST